MDLGEQIQSLVACPNSTDFGATDNGCTIQLSEGKARSCSRLRTVVGLSASANDLVDHHRDISRRGSCRDACVLVFVRERADSSSTEKARTTANGSSDSNESWAGAL